MFEDFDFGKYIIKKYIDFDYNSELSLENNLDNLKEDLIQIKYENNYALDVGWYPEYNIDGKFQVIITKNFDWDNLVFVKRAEDIVILEKNLSEAVSIIQNKIKCFK